MEVLELPYYSLTPGVKLFPLPLWYRVKGCAGAVVRLSAHDMSDPSPSPSHDDGTHDAVLVAVARRCWLEMV